MPGSSDPADPFDVFVDPFEAFVDPFASSPAELDHDPFDEPPEHPPALDEVIPPDSLERMAQEEVDEIAAGFRRRMNREAERLDLVLDTDYWCCLCFQTYDQLVAFLDATGWRRIGERYLDGLAVARALGVALPPSPTWPRVNRDPDWEAFVMDTDTDAD